MRTDNIVVTITKTNTKVNIISTEHQI